MTHSTKPTTTAVVLLLALPLVALTAACGSGSGATSAASQRPQVVVTTDVLGDVVSEMTGDLAEIDVVMRSGSDPHEFQPSAKQISAMNSADVLVINGAGFEVGLTDTIEAARANGVQVCAAIEGVDTLPGNPVDPHFFTDPSRMAQAVDHLSGCIAEAVGVGADFASDLADAAAAYHDELMALDAEVEEILEVIPAGRRLLVTDHEAFDYFADRYDFTVVGAIIPSTSSQARADAASLAELSDQVDELDVPAIFTSAAAPTDLAESLSSEVGDGAPGDVQVVEIHIESLGDTTSYVDMTRTNATRIAEALR